MSIMRNWTINSYKNGVWTTLVKAPAIVRALVIANSSSAPAEVSARISNGNAEERSIILPPTDIEAGISQVVDLCQLNLGRNDELQFQFSISDVSVTASGEEV